MLDQRHQAYKACVDREMKRSAYGTSYEVHQACLDWSRRAVK